MYLRKENRNSGNHKCQIDCTNHDAVINNLQLKSKDLYYFWRNYEWLYNKFYSRKPQQNLGPKVHQLEQQVKNYRVRFEQLLSRYQTMESQIIIFQTESRTLKNQNNLLKSQNNVLKDEVNSLKNQIRQLQSQLNAPKPTYKPQLDEDYYTRQITRLKAKSSQYQSIIDKQSQQINKYILQIQNLDTQLNNYKRTHQREIMETKRIQNNNIDLQRTIDQLRLKLNLQQPIIHTNTQEINILQEKHRIQINRLQTTIRNLQLSIQKIINQQMEGARQDLLQQLPNLVQFSSTEIQSLIINVESNF